MDQHHTDRFLETVKSSTEAGDPQILLHAVYEAVIRGDYDELAGLVADDVELHISGFGALNGSWRGRADMLEATRRNFSMLVDQKPQVQSMVSQGDRVAVLLRETGTFKTDGRTYNVQGVQWFTFEGGKLKRVDEIMADVSA